MRPIERWKWWYTWILLAACWFPTHSPTHNHFYFRFLLLLHACRTSLKRNSLPIRSLTACVWTVHNFLPPCPIHYLQGLLQIWSYPTICTDFVIRLENPMHNLLFMSTCSLWHHLHQPIWYWLLPVISLNILCLASRTWSFLTSLFTRVFAVLLDMSLSYQSAVNCHSRETLFFYLFVSERYCLSNIFSTFFEQTAVMVYFLVSLFSLKVYKLFFPTYCSIIGQLGFSCVAALRKKNYPVLKTFCGGCSAFILPSATITPHSVTSSARHSQYRLDWVLKCYRSATCFTHRELNMDYIWLPIPTYWSSRTSTSKFLCLFFSYAAV